MQKQYPTRLHHKIPSWVKDECVFHIRIRCASENTIELTQEDVAVALLKSAKFYAQKGRWFIHLLLLMPDHIHALISFPRGEIMGHVIGDWKRYQGGQHDIRWQDNFFDHRIRNAEEYLEKAAYIRRNPVAADLCETPENWQWVIE